MTKVIISNADLRKNLKTSAFVLYVAMAFFAMLFWASTNFFFLSDDFGHDAGLFAYIGYAVTQGKVMYLEAWDNKGPLLYLIYALGILIDYRYGVCIIEFITLLSTILLLYKTANLFLTKEASTVCAIACVMPFTKLLEGGGFSEEFALPFTILAFYLISKYLVNGFKLKKIEMVIVGACISAVFLLRMNILAFLGCAVLGVIIILIKNKKYKDIGTVFVFALTGFVIFLIPFVVFLVSTGALKACIESAYLQTLGSFADMTFMNRLNAVNLMAQEMAGSGYLYVMLLFLFLFLLKAIAYKEKSKTAFDQLCWISVFGMIATLFVNGLSGAAHRHYFISFIPVLIIPLVALTKMLFELIDEKCSEKFRTDDFKAAAAWILVVLISASGLFSMIKYYIGSKNPDYMSYARSVAKFIEDNTDETDLIEVIGDGSAVTSYYGAKRMAASNYLYYANGRFSDDAKIRFATKIYDDVTRTEPKLIMFEDVTGKLQDFKDHCNHSKEWDEFISENYTLVENPFEYTIYMHK